MRRSLQDIELTGWRAAVRSSVLLLAMVLATAAVIASPLAMHELDGAHHRTLGETGYLPLIGALALVGVLYWAMRGKLLRALFAGVLVGVGAFILSGISAFPHFFSTPRSNAAEATMLASFFALFFAGGVIFVVEWIVVIAERRHLERQDPVFPAARIVR